MKVLEVTDLIGYKSRVEIAGSHGNGKSRSIVMETHIIGSRLIHVEYDVILNGEMIYRNNNLDVVVYEYNKH